MQDLPEPRQLVAAVATFLRSDLLPKLDGAVQFQMRVAINALDVVVRELSLAPEADIAEVDRLSSLLERAGSRDDLNRALADGLSDGTFDLETPGVRAHLWATTMAKLAVDQPNYASYKRELRSIE